jgi:hypothetical protein
MLTFITHNFNLLAMAASLWMAFYLFARGFPNRITLRATLALMAIAVFFLDTYNSFYNPASNTSHLRAALLVIALACWYSVTFALRTPQEQARFRPIEFGFYLLATCAIIFLITIKSGIVRGQEDILYTARLEWNVATLLYGVAQLWACVGILYNLRTIQQIRYTEEGKFFFFASWFLGAAIGYGILSFLIPVRFPRIIQDGLVFGGVFLLGVSVARHQSLLERRTIWQDFPIGLLGISFITVGYLTICIVAGLPPILWGNIVAIVITSHALYDIGREAVERWRMNQDRHRRQKMNQFKTLEEETLHIFLDEELRMLLQTLNSSSGLIAMREGEDVVVAATHNSLPMKGIIPKELCGSEGLVRANEQIRGLVWSAAIFEGTQPVALVGIGHSKVKLEYSGGELELFEEFSEQIGVFISMYRAKNVSMQAVADHIADSLTVNVEAGLYKSVEDALRHFSDVLYLGQSSLADWLDIQGAIHIERGKKLQGILREAVSSLRPTGERPPEPLPRDWYNYIVLHDAYIQGVQNREVMARLYISEGTYHRIRRNAIRGLARNFEKKKL